MQNKESKTQGKFPAFLLYSRSIATGAAISKRVLTGVIGVRAGIAGTAGVETVGIYLKAAAGTVAAGAAGAAEAVSAVVTSVAA